MSSAYQIMVAQWQIFLDVFIVSLASHIVFYFYLWFVGLCKEKYHNRKNKVQQIRIVPGVSSKY